MINRKKLIASSVTYFWVGAYRLLGAPWAHNKLSKNTSDHEQPKTKSARTGANFAQVTVASKAKVKIDTSAQSKAPSPNAKEISFGAGTR
jgi:hypothetical protein